MNQINYGKRCVCQQTKITICRKCELWDSLKIANAFTKSGYIVTYNYCKKHKKENRK